MILSGQEIRQRCEYTKRPLLDPFHERTTTKNNLTYGVGPAGYDVRVGQGLILHPRAFALASTMERFHMPDDLQAVVHDKSTWARRGLAVQNTIIDPGFRGWLTLELSNHSDTALTIEGGDAIAQVIFHRLSMPAEQPYSGYYQDQREGPQPAKGEDLEA